MGGINNITNTDHKLASKILTFLGRSDIDFLKDILLYDDGDGVQYIKEWNVAETPPTQEQIDAL